LLWVLAAGLSVFIAGAGATLAVAEDRPLPYPRIAAGDSLLKLGQVDRAEAEYLAGLELAKSFQAGLTPREEGLCLANAGLARVALSRKQADKAEAHLDACKNKPKFEGKYLGLLGLTRHAQGRPDEAQTALIQGAARLDQEATPGSPPDPLRLEVAYAQVEIAEAKGLPGVAVNHLDEVIALAPKDPEPLIRKGKLLVATREYDQALQAFSQAVRVDSTAVDAYREVATLFTRAKKPREAAQAFSRLVKYEPTAANYMALGAAMEGSRQPVEALAAFEKALELEPTSTRARLGVARAAAQSGDKEKALATYQAITAKDSLTVEDYENMGRAHLDRKEYAASRDAYMRAVALDSTRSEARYYVGYTYFVEQKWKEAIPYFEARIKADSSWAPAYANLGIAYLQAGEAARGIQMLEHAVRLEGPEASQSQVLLAQALMSQAQWSRATAEFQAVLARQPENADAWRGLGYCLLSQERYNEAVDALGKAHTLSPGNVDGMNALAQAYGSNGQLGQAESLFRQVLAIDPGSKPARDGLEAIEKINKGRKKS
jgi:tetratricopeptide (TPR) repeat protein